jgi:acetyl esterase
MRALKTLFNLPRILRVRKQLLADSDAAWAARIGARALHIDGRTLHPRGQGYIEFLRLMRAPVEQWTVAGMRSAFEMGAKNFGGHAIAGVSTEALHITLPGRTLAARKYLPTAHTEELVSAILFFHGGGFVIGSIETHDRLCRYLAAAFGGPVISVDYRLAPEHRLPAAFEDAVDAYAWLLDNGAALGIATSAISLAGDSAGAGMALGVCTHAVETGTVPVPAALGLIYPPFGLDNRTASKSRLENEEIVLNKALLDWFAGHCLPEDLSTLPSTEVDFSRFPPTSLYTCGFDPLRDEGALLASRLEAAGAHVVYQEIEHLFHGFATLGALFPEVQQMAGELGAFLAGTTVGHAPHSA